MWFHPAELLPRPTPSELVPTQQPLLCSAQPHRHEVYAAAALAHWADLLPSTVQKIASANEHRSTSSRESPLPILGCGALVYQQVSDWTEGVGVRLHQAEHGFDRGVDAAESALQRPNEWLKAQTHNTPVVGHLAAGGAYLGRLMTQLLGGVAKGAGSAAFGLANVLVHPVDTLLGFGRLGAHLPGSPFWAAHKSYRLLRDFYSSATQGRVPQLAPELLTLLHEDAACWQGVGAQLLAPYRAAVQSGKPMEAVGRGAFDLGVLVLGAWEAKAVEAGELSKVANLSKAKAAGMPLAEAAASLGEGSKLTQASEAAQLAKRGKVPAPETTGPRHHSIYDDGHLVPARGEPPRLPEGPDPRAEGAHTRLRWDAQTLSRSGPGNGRVYQGREFDLNGNPVRDIDFTSPTYPSGRPRPDHMPPPHEHRWFLNDPNNPRSGYKRSKSPTPFEG